MSLRHRLLGMGLLVVLIFAAGMGSALDLAFRNVAETLRMERLQTQIYMLLASADLNEGEMSMPDVLPEPKLATPASGMYALIRNDQGEKVWRSSSMLGQEIEKEITPSSDTPLGEFKTELYREKGGQELFVVSYGVAWVTDQGEHRFSLAVAEDQLIFLQQINSFRQALWGWLALFVVLLLSVQVAILHWALRPLRQAEAGLQEMVAGRAERLEGTYPKELSGLIKNLNKLIYNERERMQHYRKTLANLAHSLKTPLAVMKSAIEGRRDRTLTPELSEFIEQIDRIDMLVEYQLIRASTSGKMTFHTPLPIRPVLEKVIRSVQKVYLDKNLSIALHAPEEAVFHGAEGDLMEMVGNLIDNGCKWSERQLAITVSLCDDALSNLPVSSNTKPQWLEIRVEDDGPGMEEDEVARLSQRGVRGDESVPGQGIGLAVVREVIEAYQGHLKFSRSRWNGTQVSLLIPLN